MKLKSILFLSTALFSFTAFADNTLNPNISNLDVIKKQLIQYHNSGQYMDDIADVDQQAETYLQQRADKNNESAHPQELAIVFDIDETSLSN